MVVVVSERGDRKFDCTIELPEGTSTLRLPVRLEPRAMTMYWRKDVAGSVAVAFPKPCGPGGSEDEALMADRVRLPPSRAAPLIGRLQALVNACHERARPIIKS